MSDLPEEASPNPSARPTQVESEALRFLMELRDEIIKFLAIQRESLVAAQSEVEALRDHVLRDQDRLASAQSECRASATALAKANAENEMLSIRLERLVSIEIDSAARIDSLNLSTQELLQRVHSLEQLADERQRLNEALSTELAEVRHARDLAQSRIQELQGLLTVIFSGRSWRALNALRTITGINARRETARRDPASG